MADRLLNMNSIFFLFCAALTLGSSLAAAYWLAPKPAAWGESAF